MKRSRDHIPGQYAGPSILERTWTMLDELVDQIMSDRLSLPGSEQPETVAEALGVARVLALFLNPYNPDVNAVRAEAMRRWEDRQA